MAESREVQISRALGLRPIKTARFEYWKDSKGNVLKFDGEIVKTGFMPNLAHWICSLDGQVRIRQRVRELWCDDSAYVCVYHKSEESFDIELWDGRTCLFLRKSEDTEAEAWEEALLFLWEKQNESK